MFPQETLHSSHTTILPRKGTSSCAQLPSSWAPACLVAFSWQCLELGLERKVPREEHPNPLVWSMHVVRWCGSRQVS